MLLVNLVELHREYNLYIEVFFDYIDRNIGITISPSDPPIDVFCNSVFSNILLCYSSICMRRYRIHKMDTSDQELLHPD